MAEVEKPLERFEREDKEELKEEGKREKYEKQRSHYDWFSKANMVMVKYEENLGALGFLYSGGYKL